MKEKNAIKLRQEKLRKQLIEQLKRVPIVETSCQRINVGRSSYYRWRRENKKFSDACDRAIEEGCQLINDLAENMLIGSMRDGNLTAVMYWLNHRHSIYRNQLEINGRVEVKKEKLTKDEEKEIMRALKLASLITNTNRTGGSNENESKNNQKIDQKPKIKK